MVNIWVYDIETTPNLVYAWGLWDQNIGINQIVEAQDILCFAAKKLGSKGVEAHASWDGYEQMVRRLHEIMDEADYLVGYNHVRYDNKHVRAAFAKLNIPPPSPHRDIDLLRVVKKQFTFPSHKLDYVCRALGLGVKVPNGGMDTWINCMNGDALAQRRMLQYNRQDVRITEQLYERLLPWIDGLNLPLYDESGQMRCIYCEHDTVWNRGYSYATAHRYRRYQCAKCGGWMKHYRSEPTPNAVLRKA